MGMFDYVQCDYPLPNDPPTDPRTPTPSETEPSATTEQP